MSISGTNPTDVREHPVPPVDGSAGVGDETVAGPALLPHALVRAMAMSTAQVRVVTFTLDPRFASTVKKPPFRSRQPSHGLWSDSNHLCPIVNASRPDGVLLCGS
jgi:hypothetical protein